MLFPFPPTGSLNGNSMFNAVYSKELKWLPKGSEFIQESDNPMAKPVTYTSFSSSQDSMPELSNNPVAPTEDNIIIAKLGPGQVRIFYCQVFV